MPSLLLLDVRVIFHCRRSSSVSSRTGFNTPCVTPEDSKKKNKNNINIYIYTYILRIGPHTQPSNWAFFFLFPQSSKFGAISEKKKKGEKNRTFYFFFFTRRPNVEKPKRTWCAIIPEDAPDRPTCAFALDWGKKKKEEKKNCQSSRGRKKGEAY